jgi:broad specificity phosphatase PhoE
VPRFHFLTHPEVVIDPEVAITHWPLSERGLERLSVGLAGPCFQNIGALHTSTERKAIDTARSISAHLALPYMEHGDLGENDRSSTGYLPREEFENVADRFFAEPNMNVRGWARAIDEQSRIVDAVRRIASESNHDQTTLIVSHGAVGALLMAALSKEPISRRYDQPGEGGGNWFSLDAENWTLTESWRSIEP